MPNKLTYGYVKNYVEVDSNSGCKLISTEYKNNIGKLSIVCKCGNIFEKTWVSFRAQSYCLICGAERRRKLQTFTYEYVKKFIETELGFILLSTEYKTARLVLEVQCSQGHIFYPTFDSLHNKRTGCPYCVGVRYTYEMIKDYVENERGFKLLTLEYHSCLQKLQIQCKEGHIFTSTMQILKQNCGCTTCNKSKGENKVLKYLIENNVKYDKQYKFDDCRHKNCLPFDFVIFNDSGDIECLIEYQGMQHFKEVGYFKGKDKLESQIRNDNIKREYCKNNNINLLEISYLDFNNVENILDEYFQRS